MVLDVNLAGVMTLQRDKATRKIGSAYIAKMFLITGWVVGCLLSNVSCAYESSGIS